MHEIKHNHTINNVTNAFLTAHPHLKRSQEDMEHMDANDFITEEILRALHSNNDDYEDDFPNPDDDVDLSTGASDYSGSDDPSTRIVITISISDVIHRFIRFYFDNSTMNIHQLREISAAHYLRHVPIQLLKKFTKSREGVLVGATKGFTLVLGLIVTETVLEREIDGLQGIQAEVAMVAKEVLVHPVRTALYRYQAQDRYSIYPNIWSAITSQNLYSGLLLRLAYKPVQRISKRYSHLYIKTYLEKLLPSEEIMNNGMKDKFADYSSGVISWLISAPLAVVSTYMQLHSDNEKGISALVAVQELLRHKGIIFGLLLNGHANTLFQYVTPPAWVANLYRRPLQRVMHNVTHVPKWWDKHL